MQFVCVCKNSDVDQEIVIDKKISLIRIWIRTNIPRIRNAVFRVGTGTGTCIE